MERNEETRKEGGKKKVYIWVLLKKILLEE
jgi:hypothetical protein